MTIAQPREAISVVLNRALEFFDCDNRIPQCLVRRVGLLFG